MIFREVFQDIDNSQKLSIIVQGVTPCDTVTPSAKPLMRQEQGVGQSVIK